MRSQSEPAPGLPPDKGRDDSRGRVGRFLFVFVVLYVAMHALYFAVPDRILAAYVHQPGLVAPAAVLVRWLSADEDVKSVGGSLHSSRAVVRIVRGCDGAGIGFLMVGAVAALPARRRLKLVGLLLTGSFVHLVNVIRVVALYYVAAYRIDWFPLVHDFVAPILFVMATALAFAWWAGWSTAHRAVPH